MNIRQKGGVSLFIVIFAALITTVVSVSFTQAMIRNQQQSTASDLSQRAYDSSLAGVEDAKRLLVAMYSACNGGDATECQRLRAIISDPNCDRIVSELGGQQNSDTGNLERSVGIDGTNQAYTCIKIALSTSEYEDSMNVVEPTVLPLRSDEDFNSVRITWFTKDDAKDASTPTYTTSAPKLPQAGPNDWKTSNPSLLRLQLIPGSVRVSQLDTEAKTVYLYPRDAGSNTVANFDTDTDSGVSPIPITCSKTFANIKGVCSATISLQTTKSAYLQLAAFYNSTHFTIELLNGASPVKFDDVQPAVDVTGRADNLFRRIEAKVKVGAVSTAYPDGAVTTATNFCKAFTYQDDQTYGGYSDGSCEP